MNKLFQAILSKFKKNRLYCKDFFEKDINNIHPHILKHYNSLSKNYFNLSENSKPWMTLSMIDFLDERLNKSLDVFEFGSGNSTIYFAQKCKSVCSVEHRTEWFEKVVEMINKISLNNTKIMLLKEEDEYSAKIQDFKKKYDIILIDSKDRNKCMRESVQYLKDGGVIILDNSERVYYKSGIKFLLKNGFKKLNFEGIVCGSSYYHRTTLFYRNDNCLKI